MAGERIGIVGGGQLGRMLTYPAKLLGNQVMVLDPTTREGKHFDHPASPALQFGAEQIVGDLHDEEKIRRLAKESSIVTWEIEHINTAALMRLVEEGVDVQPSPWTLAKINDKYRQKKLLKDNGIPTAESWPINTPIDLDMLFMSNT
ncbi:MAG TPA: hypothetical protein VFW90_00375, partial [Candidatus Saccharimonadales bacterium]|nr:hypothetical protein [Candidatus Saccharimonadales bacterium]